MSILASLARQLGQRPAKQPTPPQPTIIRNFSPLPGEETAIEEPEVPYKIEPEFRSAATQVATRLGVKPDHLLALMNFETGGQFKADTRNKTSGATGLIQFMDKTAKSLGTTTEDLAKMTPVEQLAYVEKYLAPYKGKLKTLEDAYMAVLWPAAVGKPADHVLWRKGTVQYAQNSGLDIGDKGYITKGDAAKKVHQRVPLDEPIDNRPVVGTLASTGRPMLANPDGSVSTEESITITDERLNGGRPTNIPSIWGGKRRSDEDAITEALRSGQTFPSFTSIPAAVAAAEARSRELGDEVDRRTK